MNREMAEDKKKQIMRSEIWSHFTKLDGGNKAKCNYCGKSYACDSTKIGTSGLWKHFRNCQAYKSAQIDERQKVLTRQLNDTNGGDDGVVNITAIAFNKEACRRAMVKMIIVDELPFSFVDGVGFRKFLGYACPKFDIPSRRTVTRDILKLYNEEKELLKGKLISNKQKVCLTTDCWTSIQNISYMVITAHFIDKSWMLHKRILNFSVVPNHKGETIGKLIESCLLDWGIECVSTITIDNASANDGAITYMKKVLKNWKVDGMILGGSFMHVRCCAHIVNLIVTDGLKEFNVAIASIRNAVKYFRSSPTRLAKFKICVEREKIECKKMVMLDVPTRWNATYLMLDSALKFEKAFDRMAEEDGFYCKYFDERENGKEREGPPTSEDWEKGRRFVKFLKTFYETTLKFSSSMNVTSNLYFKEVCNIQHLLKTLSDRQDPLLSDMAKNMKSKFDKYWGSVEKMNKLLIIAVVLDPRYKLEFVGYCIGRLYDSSLVELTKSEIKNLLYELYNQYKGWHNASNDSDKDGGTYDFNDSIAKDSTTDDWDESNNFDVGYKKLKISNDLLGKDEIQRYLMEPTEDSTNQSFDILTWWKLNCPRYAILSELARDVLAIPVSTVASESAFSTGGRILDSFRSSLTPKTVEALICTQNWLRSTLLGDRLYGVGIEETEFHEELAHLETELIKKRSHTKDDLMVVELD